MDDYKHMYKSICRLCLSYKNSKNMISLMDTSSEDGLSAFGKAVMTITNISLKKEDNLPSSMCYNCAFLLKQAIRFRKICESTNKQLKNLLNTSRLKKVHNRRNIMKNVCEYVLFTQCFPEDKKLPSSTQVRKSIEVPIVGPMKIEVAPIISERNSIKPENETNDSYDFEVTIQNEDYSNHSSTDNKDLDCKTTLEQKIKTKVTKKSKLKKIKDIDSVITTSSNDITKFFDTMEHLIDSGALDNDMSSETKKIIKKQSILPQKSILDRTKLINLRKIRLKRNRQKNKQNPNSKERNLQCNICNKILANRLTFDHHMQRHNRCQYICDQCGKGFPVLVEMHMHQVARHGTGPYLQCDHCPYKAPRKLNLIEHLRLHTGERPFTCEKCGLTFRRRALWRNHLVLHMEKKCQCPYCPRKFFRPAQVEAHCNNVHERKYLYMCNICSITYTKSETVRRHMIAKHGVPREKQGRIARIVSGSGNFPLVKEN